MKNRVSPRAVLDVGSNTIRLLVGRVEAGSVVPLLDRSEFVRLGTDVDRTHELRADRIVAGVSAIERLAAAARDAGAEEVTAFATSAVRDAMNGRNFVDEAYSRTGVHIEIISGEREALLTYRGATLGIDVAEGVIVCDLGGGSAEIVHADAGGIRWGRSEPLGSGRLSERYIRNDPPGTDEVRALQAHVREVLAALPKARANRAVFTGGTATHAALLLGTNAETAAFQPSVLARALKLSRSAPSATVAASYDFRPERAAVLPAGLAALQAIADFYGVREVAITRHGIREGVLLSGL